MASHPELAGATQPGVMVGGIQQPGLPTLPAPPTPSIVAPPGLPPGAVPGMGVPLNRNLVGPSWK